MAVLPTCLDLTLSLIPSSTSSPSLPSSGEDNEGDENRGRKRDLEINEVALIEEEGEEDLSSSSVPRKKLRLTKEQSILLEESFRHNHTLNPKEKESLANKLKLKARQVEVWFQNRRARTRLKQIEMECDYLKKWLASLTEQNRMLKNEVELLKAMKLGPPTVMMASGLTMCSRCELVTHSKQNKV